jgi:hypothetical protein
MSSSGYRDRLLRFMQKYTPEKVAGCDQMLEKYRGKEEEMFRALVTKFGPEPQNLSPSAPQVQSFRERVVAFYKHHAPEKIGGIDEALERFKGKEDQMMQALVAKYGPEPVAAVAAPSPPQQPPPTTLSSGYRDRLLRFMQKYTPEKVAGCDQMLEKYRGKEEEMFRALVTKFGPEPQNLSPSPPQGPEPSAVAAPAPRQQIQDPDDTAEAEAEDQPQNSSVPLNQTEKKLSHREHLIRRIGSKSLDALESFVASVCSGRTCSTLSEAEKNSIAVLLLVLEFVHFPPRSTEDDVVFEDYPMSPIEHVDHCALDAALAFTKLKTEEGSQLNALEMSFQETIHEMTLQRDADLARIERLVSERTAYKRAVVSRALQMIHTLEAELRQETWKVQEIEALGRFSWFQEKKQQIVLNAKPLKLEALEEKFKRWKKLVAEQRHEIDELKFENAMRSTARSLFVASSERANASPLPPTAAYPPPSLHIDFTKLAREGSRGTPNSCRGTGLRSVDSPIVSNRKLIAETVGKSHQSNSNAEGSSIVLRKDYRRKASPRPSRVTANTPRPVWDQRPVQRNKNVYVSEGSGLPKKMKIPTTIVRPFSFER